jgi:hypothetical protein
MSVMVNRPSYIALVTSIIALLFVLSFTPSVAAYSPHHFALPATCVRKQCKMNGQWNDTAGFVWKVAGTGTYANYTIEGKVNTSSDGGPIYSVEGSGSGPNFTMTASNIKTHKFCPSFTYTGALSNQTFATGTWKDSCGHSGDFTMIKTNQRGTEIVTTTTDTPNAS